ncbi:MAG: hypothetical protein IT378_20650 [Sandaracinaceae bacterium]|nr:hypothetical protein [Sandaracinaceae bacterium]
MRFLLSVFVLAGCSGGCGGPSPDPASGDPPAEAVGGEQARDPLPPSPPPPADPPLGVRLTGEVDGARHVAIRLENRGTELARVAPRVGIEALSEDGAWVRFEREAQLKLRYDCGAEPPSCVELAPGGTLLPPPWLGTRGDAQCVCERCVPAPPGRYRFVVHRCDGAEDVEGEPFALP